MNFAYNAMLFAREVHKEQRRKYTNDPYFIHLAEVAGIVATLDNPEQNLAIAVAYLHDSMEDQNVHFQTLVNEFGIEVAEGVRWLTDVEEGNRATRKALARERLAAAPRYIQTIKCADCMSNTVSILLHDKDFAKVYVKEMEELLSVLDNADSRLWVLAHQAVREGQA